ncbi:MAG: hypothetical protein JXB49_05905 [Bacteroidales bacterium]|nr:hypothetical protein [Bacteroidales bacterium]
MKRYKRGTYKIYNEHYNMLRLSSQILNGGSIRPSIHMIFWDKQSILGMILELEGNEQGKYFKSGELRYAKIPIVQEQLKSIKNRFYEYQRQKRNEGFEQTDKYPPFLERERLLTEAQLDVLKEELTELNRRLSTYTDQEKTESDSKVLAYGLRCHCKLKDGRIFTIDGQYVKEINGVMTINDQRSPYDKLPVSEYRQLAKQWLSDRKEADRKKLLRLQEQAKAENKPIPQSLGVSAPSKIARASLPKCPVLQMHKTK